MQFSEPDHADRLGPVSPRPKPAGGRDLAPIPTSRHRPVEAYIMAMYTLIIGTAKAVMTIETAVLTIPMLFASIASTLEIDREWQVVWFAFIGGALGGFCNAGYDLLLYLVRKHTANEEVAQKDKKVLRTFAILRTAISMPFGFVAATVSFARNPALHLFEVMGIAFSLAFLGLALRPIMYNTIMRSIKEMEAQSKKDKI